MNYKRKRPKHQRSGCLMCKPHKDERRKKLPKKPDWAGRPETWEEWPGKE